MARNSTGWLTLLGALALGCAGARVESVQSYAGDRPLPSPDVVLVYDFDLTGSEIRPDSALSQEIARKLEDASYTEEQLALGRDVATVLAEHLTAKLRELGLPAERAFAPPIAPRNTLMVSGAFLTIDQGNRTKRMTVGFGAGSTEIRTRVDVYQASAEGPRLLEEFETSATGSKKPGMLVPVGAGAAAGRALTSVAVSGGISALAEKLGGVGGDAQRTAEEIAQRVGYLAARQGWIPMQALQ